MKAAGLPAGMIARMTGLSVDEMSGNSPHSWGFNTIWKNEWRELSDTGFLLLQTSECRQLKPAGMNCPASQGDEPEGAEGGSHPRGHYGHFVFLAAVIMVVLFPLRNDTRGWETPPALRATSPARRRSFFPHGQVRVSRHLITNEYSSVVKSPRLGTVPFGFAMKF